MISAILLTFNEELNLPFALQSLGGCIDQIFIVDSSSRDRTTAIAREYGCSVVSHPFENQAVQFNWALDNLPIPEGWILRLDADEYLLPALASEIRVATSSAPADVTGFYLRRRMVFLDRWIRYGAYYPIWLLRLFRVGCARSEITAMDEHLVLTRGRARRLTNDFVDHNRKGLSAWLRKHEAYAARQAEVLTTGASDTTSTGVAPKLLGTQAERKRWFKSRFYQNCPLFLRSGLYFIYRYVLRGGFLDGNVGLIFHFLHACWYPFYVDAIIYERRRHGAAVAGRVVEQNEE